MARLCGEVAAYCRRGNSLDSLTLTDSMTDAGLEVLAVRNAVNCVGEVSAEVFCRLLLSSVLHGLVRTFLSCCHIQQTLYRRLVRSNDFLKKFAGPSGLHEMYESSQLGLAAHMR